MPFPFGIEGTVTAEVPPNGGVMEETVADALVAELRDAKASWTAKDANTISFKSGFFRLVTDRNPLVGINGGEITVARDTSTIRIGYRLSTWRVCLIGVVLGVFFLVTTDYPWPLLWLLLPGIGFEYIFAAVKFRRFATRILQTTISGSRNAATANLADTAR